MKFSCIAAGPDHLYTQILFQLLSLSQNEEVPRFHRTNVKAFYIVLVEKRREQLCIKADAVSYIKESCNFVPAMVRESIRYIP